MSLGTKLRRLGRPGVISSCLCLHRADCVSYEWVVIQIPSDQLPRAICIPSPLQLIVFALLLLPVLHSSPPPSCDSVVASFISPNTHASSLANLIDCASLQHPAAAFYLGMHYVNQGDHVAAAAAFLTCYTSDGGSSACLTNYINTAPLHDHHAVDILVHASSSSSLPLPPHHLQESLRARLIATSRCPRPFPVIFHQHITSPIVACAVAAAYSQCCVGWPPDRSQLSPRTIPCVATAARAFALARRLGGYISSNTTTTSSSSCGTIGLAALLPLLVSSSSSSSFSSSSAANIITRHIHHLYLHPPPPSMFSQLKELAFSVLADASMAGGEGEAAAWALGKMEPDGPRDLRMMHAVVSGMLWKQHAAAVAAAESAVHAMSQQHVGPELACSALDGVGGMSRFLPPFVTLSVPWSVPWVTTCFLQHAHTSLLHKAVLVDACHPSPPFSLLARDPRIRVGLISSDFRYHPTTQLLHEVLGQIKARWSHRLSLVGIFCGGGGRDDDTQLIINNVNEWFDVSNDDDATAAAAICALQPPLHIAIDIDGFTSAARPAILTYNVAPVTASYLGFMHPMTRKRARFFITDAQLSPPDIRPLISGGGDARQFLSAYAYVPGSSYPTGTFARIRKRADGSSTSARKSAMLCNLGQPHKLSPAFFAALHTIACDAWFPPLRTVGPVSKDELVGVNVTVAVLQPGRAAAARQIEELWSHLGPCEGHSASPPLLLLPRLSKQQHLDRLRDCSIFADTWPYGAHTVLVDAATRGVPTVSFVDFKVQGRVSASVANEFRGCIYTARTIQDYVSLSTRLLRRQSRQRAPNSCSQHDESTQEPSSSLKANRYLGERHAVLADGLAGLLRLMWEHNAASNNRNDCAALVPSSRHASL